jgi:hypothetical protein
MARKTGHWYLSAVRGIDGEVKTVIGVSRRKHYAREVPVSSNTIRLRSLCSGFVGMPVLGPERWQSTITSGISPTRSGRRLPA